MPDYGDVWQFFLFLSFSFFNSKLFFSSYWNDRYRAEYTENFDWLFEYKDISEIIPQIFNLTSQILMVGSGNATFSYDL